MVLADVDLSFFLLFIYFFTSDCLANKDVLQRRPRVIVHFALDQVWQHFISESNLKRTEERLGHHGSLQLVCTASLLKLIPHAPLKHIPCLSVHATWWAEHGPWGTGWLAYTVRDQPTPTLDIKKKHMRHQQGLSAWMQCLIDPNSMYCICLISAQWLVVVFFFVQRVRWSCLFILTCDV